MRLKNDAVRESILSAAKEEFFAHGYKDANMRDIAEKAGITSGNIYRYYPSKEALFEALVGDVNKDFEKIAALKGTILSEFLALKKGFANPIIRFVISKVYDLRYEVLLLVEKSAGSKYEHSIDKLIDYAANAICNTMVEKDLDLAYVYANATFGGMLNILKHNFDDEKKVKKLAIKFMNSLYSSDIFEN